MKLYEIFSKNNYHTPLYELDTITENKEQYSQMVNSFLKSANNEEITDSERDTLQKMARRVLNFAIALKKNDRAAWYIKKARAILSDTFLDPNSPTYKKATKDEPDFRKYSINEFNQKINHYLSMPVHKIKKEIWVNQTIDELFSAFDKYEKEWADAMSNGFVEIEEGDQLIIETSKNEGWWLLDRYSCSAEANAMGHCGNKATGTEGERILSFRTRSNDQKSLWKPHLTFILDSFNTLGEMKGRANNKPASKYHPAIMDLLLSDYVRGIKGGGYEAHQNFSVHDLSDTNQEILKENKPELMSMEVFYEKYSHETYMQDFIEEFLDSHDIRYEDINTKDGYFTMESFTANELFTKNANDDVESVYNTLTNDTSYVDISVGSYDIENIFDNLPSELQLKIEDYVDENMNGNIEEQSIGDIIMENSDDPLYDIFNMAIRDGYRFGIEKDMIDFLRSAIEQSINEFELCSLTVSDDYILDATYTVNCDIDRLLSVYDRDPDYVDGLTPEVDIGRETIVHDYIPYYGFDGYDPNAADETFRENISSVLST